MLRRNKLHSQGHSAINTLAQDYVTPHNDAAAPHNSGGPACMTPGIGIRASDCTSVPSALLQLFGLNIGIYVTFVSFTEIGNNKLFFIY